MPDPRTLLLTRPEDQARAFALALEARLPGRFAPIFAPLLHIVPVPGPLDLAGVQALLFTSANGVDQFAARTPRRDLPALCVGDMTAEAARRAGFRARSADGDVAGLAALAAAVYRPGAGAFLHVRGRHAAGDLLGRLAAAGLPGRAAELYDQAAAEMPPEAAGLLANGGVASVALFSPRSAALFAARARAAGWSLATTTAVSLSAAADAALDAPEPGRRVVAAAPTRAGMLDALATV